MVRLIRRRDSCIRVRPMTALVESPAAAPAPVATEARVCVLCGETFSTFSGIGNNPWPLASPDDGDCCNQCNSTRVIPARLARIEAKA
jgi:hypothetical protein